MKKNVIKKIGLGLALILCGAWTYAQHLVEYKLALPLVSETGYYNVLLSPEVMAFSRWNSFSDIRIKDEQHNEVPYLLRQETPSIETKNYLNFKLLSHTFKDSANYLVVDNSKRNTIDQFCITIKQSDVLKSIQLKGSNDLKTWFIVKQEEYAPLGFSNNNGTEETIVYDFPRGNYKYYQIKLGNQERAPLEIVNVGKYEYSELLGKYTAITLPVTQVNKNKKTYLYLSQLPHRYCVDRIDFDIHYKDNYLRYASICGDTSQFQPNVYSFTLSSLEGTPQYITRDFPITSNAEIVINNKDNTPLRVDSMTVYLRCRYICLKLEKGVNYTLLGGNDTTGVPEYDMGYFAQNIPRQLPLLHMSKATIIPKPQLQPVLVTKEKPAFWKNPAFLWIAIVVVVLLLIFICFSMIKELGKKDTH